MVEYEYDIMDRVTNISWKTASGATLGGFGYEYDTAGRLASTLSLSTRSTRSTRLNSRLYLYGNLNERVAAVDDRNFNNAIDWTGPDLVSSNATRYVSIGGDWWRETRQWSIHDDGSAESRLMGIRRSRVTGLGTDGLDSESVSIDPRGNATTNRVWRNRAAAEEVAWVKYPTSTAPAVTTSTNGLVCSSTSQTGVTTTFAYDAFERQVAQTDGRGNTTRTVYDSLGRVASTIDALGYATIYGYDALGRQTSVTDPLTNTVTTAYDAEGRVLAQRGATYPVDYAYDEFGGKVSMTTYRSESLTAGDTTRWLRDEATGLVTNKVYADGKGPSYAYTPDGRLATRTWARGVVTTYAYDSSGALTNTVYSDGTPTISLVYNRAGQQVRAEDAAGVTTFLYDDFGVVTNETVVGVAGTNTIERFYDIFGRSLGYSLNGVRQSTLAYDPATGRLASMQIPSEQSNNPNNQTIKQFSWNYLPGSDLKSSLAYPNGLTASWQYDANGQLLQVKNAFPTNTISQYDYTYDAAGRRISVSKSGSAFDQDDTIAYGYNARSELTNAVAAVDSDYRYAYDFDDIGNRESSSERGTNSVYTANNLNQYTDVDDFAPQFDDDGNQTLIKTATGIWSVTYNGENRPVLWRQGDVSLAMSYDRMGRRIRLVKLEGQSISRRQLFFYNGYLQIQRKTQDVGTADSNNLDQFVWDPTEVIATRPLVWGRDGAPLFYTHDGSKNVSEIVSSESEVSAHYEYAPFGALTLLIGDSAFLNTWRFSSEYVDDETATVYYIFRHLDVVNGRWLTRDVVDEVGGRNLYEFCFNYCFANDFCGCIVDTIWDVASVIWDVGKLSVGLVTNNPALVGEATIDLAADAVAAIIPGVPAGATKMLRIAKRGTGSVVNKVCSGTVKTRLTRRVTMGATPSIGQLRNLRGKEFQSAVSNYFKEDIVVSETKMVLKRADGSVLKAELDVTLNHTVFELKNWDRITPSGAETIILQIKRQRAVMKEFYGEGMQHGGLLISGRTKLSDKVVEMFKSEGISIKRAEYFEGEIKAFIDVSK